VVSPLPDVTKQLITYRRRVALGALPCFEVPRLKGGSPSDRHRNK